MYKDLPNQEPRVWKAKTNPRGSLKEAVQCRVGMARMVEGPIKEVRAESVIQ